MVVGGLDYSIKKKLDIEQLRDMDQLADRVRRIERQKIEKARASKNNRKERIAYNKYDEGEQRCYEVPFNLEEDEIDLVELKQRPLIHVGA